MDNDNLALELMNTKKVLESLKSVCDTLISKEKEFSIEIMRTANGTRVDVTSNGRTYNLMLAERGIRYEEVIRVLNDTNN